MSQPYYVTSDIYDACEKMGLPMNGLERMEPFKFDVPLSDEAKSN